MTKLIEQRWFGSVYKCDRDAERMNDCSFTLNNRGGRIGERVVTVSKTAKDTSRTLPTVIRAMVSAEDPEITSSLSVVTQNIEAYN